MRVTLRSLSPADLPLLERFVRAYYAEDGLTFDPERQPAALRALVGDEPLGHGWFVVLDGENKGYVVLTLGFCIEAGGRDGILDELYLEPEVRGRGIGRQVLDLVEAKARRLGLNKLYLEVEHGNRAIELYRRAGFVDHHRYLMSKQLAR